MPPAQTATKNNRPAQPIASRSVSSPNIIPRLLTIKQAAVYCACAVWAVRQAIWARELRACKIGNRFVIPREELDAYIDRKIDERASNGLARTASACAM
jgi:excisionase family DNA binding protein